jgi:hypothetical protein
MGGGLLNIVSYGNLNIIINGNPQKSLFLATYKKYTNFELQKHIITCNITTPKLKENESTTFNFTIPRVGDLISDTFFTIQMPYIWSPVWVEPSDIYDRPNTTPYSSTVEEGLYLIRDASNNEMRKIRQLTGAHIPNTQPFEFKWIEDLGSQLIQKITVSLGDTIIQEFSGDYLTNMVKRDFTNEKKDLFNKMTGNVVEMNNPELCDNRNGLYPNCLYGAPLPFKDAAGNILYKIYSNKQSVINKELNIITDLSPSINKKLLTIPLNLWYMVSSTHAFPLLSLTENSFKIKIECRPIRELFRIRDVRYYINTYYHHNIAVNNITENGSGISIYKHYQSSYYNGSITTNNGFSQFDVFKPYAVPQYISTMNTTDPLYQLYMFTTQFASQNQQFIQQAALNSNSSAQIAALLRENSIWNCNPRLISTYVYLDPEEQEVFKQKPQSYLIKQILEHFFEAENHKEFTQSRFKSNSVVVNFMWYLQRNDVFLRNEWTNYTNWPYNEKPYTLQPLYYKKLDATWYPSNVTNLSPILSEITYTTTNPDPKFSQFPELFEVSTSNTKPLDFKQTLYLSKVITPNTHTYLSESINNNTIYYSRIEAGTVIINESIQKYPPYFPFSFKSSATANGCNPYITGPNRKQTKNILVNWALKLDGKNKENNLHADYYNYVEPFLRSNGSSANGVYNYSFSLNSNPFIIDPCGYANLINYNNIDFEYEVIELEKINDITKVAILPLCNDNEFVGFNKPNWLIYDYMFTLKLFEEQFNLLTINNGLASLKFQHSN